VQKVKSAAVEGMSSVPEINKALSDGDCTREPMKSIDDMVDPEAGSTIAIVLGSNRADKREML